MKRGRCEAMRKDMNVRCMNTGWIEKDGRMVCGQHKYDPQTYVPKPAKLGACSASPSAAPTSEPDDPSDS